MYFFSVVSFSVYKKFNMLKWRFFCDWFFFYLGNYIVKNIDWFLYICFLYKRVVRVFFVYCEMKLVGYCYSRGRFCYFLFFYLLEVYWWNESLLCGICWGCVFIFISFFWKCVGRIMIIIWFFFDYFRM